MDIFVSEVNCGSYDEETKVTLYVGADYSVAKSMVENYQFPFDTNQWGKVVTWRDGKRIKTDYIRE